MKALDLQPEQLEPIRSAMERAADALLVEPKPRAEGSRLELDPSNVRKGLAQLVLTLIKLLHELMERQAIRRIDDGGLSDDQIEQLGLTLMQQAEEIERLKREYDLSDDELTLDLGPLGRLV